MPRLNRGQARGLGEGVLPGASTGKEGLENYIERVVKYVPVEIVLAYITIQSIFQIAGPDAAPRAVEFVFYALLVLVTVPYLIKFGGPVPNKMRQAIISTISFVVWTYGIGGSFFWGALEEALGTRVAYPSIAGGIVVMWSLAIGFIKPESP